MSSGSATLSRAREIDLGVKPKFGTWFSSRYEPLSAGSIDGTDTRPHDRGIASALKSKFNASKDPNLCDAGDAATTLFIARLSPKTNEQTLSEVFDKFGTIVKIRLVKSKKTGESRRYAFITFKRAVDFRRAYLDSHEMIIDQHQILVDFERGRTMPGWIPRRFGGGLGGRKESGQLRFGSRDRPFRTPLMSNAGPMKFQTQSRFQRDNRNRDSLEFFRDRDSRKRSRSREHTSQRRSHSRHIRRHFDDSRSTRQPSRFREDDSRSKRGKREEDTRGFGSSRYKDERDKSSRRSRAHDETGDSRSTRTQKTGDSRSSPSIKKEHLLVLETELSREKERLRWKRHIAYTKSDFEGRRELNKRIRHLGSSIRDLSVKVEEEKEKSTRRNTFPRSRTRSFPAKPRSAASAIGLAKGLTRRSSEGNPKPSSADNTNKSIVSQYALYRQKQKRLLRTQSEISRPTNLTRQSTAIKEQISSDKLSAVKDHFQKSEKRLQFRAEQIEQIEKERLDELRRLREFRQREVDMKRTVRSNEISKLQQLDEEYQSILEVSQQRDQQQTNEYLKARKRESARRKRIIHQQQINRVRVREQLEVREHQWRMELARAKEVMDQDENEHDVKRQIRRKSSEDRILTRSLSDPGSPSIELLEDLNTSDLIDHLSECGSSTSSGSDGVADNAIKVEVRVSKC
eukprot:239501_1